MSDEEDYGGPDEAETPGEADAELLEEARKFLSERIASEAEMREEALSDLKFLAGEQWPESVAASRKADNRPCITVNKLPVYLHQVTNDQRQNRSSIKVHPVDNAADVDIAEVIQGLIRHIEYDSNADVACDTAVNSAASIGFGFWRLVTEYCAEDSFDQDVKFRRIRNPFTVYLGPHTEPDGSDITRAIITEELDKGEFLRQYPKADVQDGVERGQGDGMKDWLGPDTVRVAEYYRVETTPEKLHRLTDGSNVFESQLPDGADIATGRDGKPQTRMSERRSVHWYKISGVEVLERSEIKCNWIPIFPVYGDEFDVDGKLYRAGLIRNAKGPSQMYNVWITAATEEIGLRPKIPFIGAVGQFDTDKKWANANARSYPYMEYDPVTVDGTMAPAPQRQPMSDVPAGVLAMAMHASDDIKATTGIFNASLGQQGNETSGKAIIARQREGDVGSFHYTDNLNRSKRHCARCILWMLPHYMDTERVVRIMGEDETVKTVSVNQPIPPEQQQPDPKTGAIKTVLNDLTVGKYDVVMSSGPSYSTQRAEFADSITQLAQAVPQLWQIAGDLIVKGMDWPNAQKIADRIKNSIPPEIIGQEEDQEPIPPQAVAQIQQLTQAKDQLEHALQVAHEEHTQLEGEVKTKAQAEQGKDQRLAERESSKHQRELQLEMVRTKNAQSIEDKRAANAARLELLRLNAAKAQSDKDAQLAIELQNMKDSTVHLTTEIGAITTLLSKSIAPPQQMVDEASGEPLGEPKEPKVDTHKMLADAISGMTEAIGSMSKPKTVIRGPDGRVQGIQ